MNRVESVIQAAVIHKVKTDWPHLMITATANERSYKETRQIGSKGITDLILFHPNGHVLWCELKKLKGTLLPSQIEWNTDFDLRFAPTPNYTRAVAYGYNQAIEIIARWLANIET